MSYLEERQDFDCVKILLTVQQNFESLKGRKA